MVFPLGRHPLLHFRVETSVPLPLQPVSSALHTTSAAQEFRLAAKLTDPMGKPANQLFNLIYPCARLPERSRPQSLDSRQW
jgi:hypothetical protein